MNQNSYKKLTPKIIGEFRTGEYSIRDLAKRHDVSIGFVAKHTAGVPRDGVEIVNAGVQYKQALATNDEHFVNAVNTVVDQRTEHILACNTAAMRNLNESMAAGCECQMDYKNRADTILKTKEVVIGKSPDTAVQVNVGDQGGVAAILREIDTEQGQELISG